MFLCYYGGEAIFISRRPAETPHAAYLFLNIASFHTCYADGVHSTQAAGIRAGQSHYARGEGSLTARWDEMRGNHVRP